MKTAVALRHIAFEDLGLLQPELERAGYEIQYREAPLDGVADPVLQNADILVVLGGPIGAYESNIYPFLKPEIALIAKRLEQGLPTLGICLGAQLMAQALGARVFPGPVKEIGWGRVALTETGRASALAPLDDRDAHVLHWHGDTFDLPEGATRLVSNANYSNQAFAIGPKALGLQFHLEADPARIECWLVGHALELAKAAIDIPALRLETAALVPVVKRQAHAIFSRWLAGL